MKQELGVIHFHLEIYQRDNGKYPASLKELKPKYLTKIPQDRFVKNQDLKYTSDGKSFKLYSVGVDGKDDKGVEYDKKTGNRDIVITIPVVKPNE